MYRVLLGTERYKVGRHRCFHLSHAPDNRRAGMNAEWGKPGEDPIDRMGRTGRVEEIEIKKERAERRIDGYGT